MKTIKRWDFGTPELLSDKQKLVFSRLHEVNLKAFESILLSMFTGKITTAVMKCDQIKYDEFIGNGEKYTVLLEETINIQMKEYQIFLNIDSTFYSMVLDKLLGGNARIANKVDKITEIEEIMLSKKFNEMFRILFKEIRNKTVFIQSYLEASSLCDNLNSNGIVVELAISINNITSAIKMFYPADFILNLIKKT